MLLDLLTFTLIPIHGNNGLFLFLFFYSLLSLDTTDLESFILLNPSSKQWTVQWVGTCAANGEFKLASSIIWLLQARSQYSFFLYSQVCTQSRGGLRFKKRLLRWHLLIFDQLGVRRNTCTYIEQIIISIRHSIDAITKRFRRIIFPLLHCLINCG